MATSPPTAADLPALPIIDALPPPASPAYPMAVACRLATLTMQDVFGKIPFPWHEKVIALMNLMRALRPVGGSLWLAIPLLQPMGAYIGQFLCYWLSLLLLVLTPDFFHEHCPARMVFTFVSTFLAVSSLSQSLSLAVVYLSPVVVVCHGFMSWRQQMLLRNLVARISQSFQCNSLRFDFLAMDNP
jgi:hypothetical protein